MERGGCWPWPRCPLECGGGLGFRAVGDWSGDYDEEGRRRRGGRERAGSKASSVTTGRDVWGRLESAVNGSDLTWVGIGTLGFDRIESFIFIFILGRQLTVGRFRSTWATHDGLRHTGTGTSSIPRTSAVFFGRLQLARLKFHTVSSRQNYRIDHRSRHHG
jgi:hypothetical protein